ncbi:MAG: CHASE2 domain-containing protein [Bacteroidota bacterium]
MLELATRLPFVDYLFPEQGALQDFEFTDFIFSKRSNDTVRHKKITVINFGSLDRRGIARLLDTLNRYNPSVVGVDAFFNCPPGVTDTARCPRLRDPEASQLLSLAIQRTKKIVLASALLNRQGIFEGDSLEVSDSIFSVYSKQGYSSFPVTSNSVAILRSFLPTLNVMGTDELAFSLQVAWQYDSVHAKKFLARNKEEELINFSGNAFFPLQDQPEQGGAFTLLNVKSYLTLTLASLALSGIAISLYENFESWRSK